MEPPCDELADRTVTLTHEFMRDAEFQRSEFYRDYLRQSDIFYALGTTVERTPDHMAVFGVQRGHRKGPFSEEAAKMVELIAPHLRRAYLTRRTLRTVTQMCATLTETLHLVASPVLVVDGSGRLEFANRGAETLLNANEGLRLNRGIVTPSSRDQAKLFAETLAKLARGLDGARPSPHDVAIQRPIPTGRCCCDSPCCRAARAATVRASRSSSTSPPAWRRASNGCSRRCA